MRTIMTKKYLALRSIPLGICDIIDGMIMILTLGQLRTRSLHLCFVSWSTSHWIAKKNKWSHKEIGDINGRSNKKENSSMFDSSIDDNTSIGYTNKLQ
jgi:hypothetical protein